MTKRLSAKERRRQILNHAISVFADTTYHGATTKKIAEDAGITEALIYRYFGSKRDLFLEAIRLTTSSLIEGLGRNLEKYKDNPLLAVTKAFSYYAEMLQNNKPLAKMIFLVFAELDQEDVRQAYLPYQKAALKKFARALEYWQHKGYMVSSFFDTYTATWLVYGTYILLALVKHSHNDKKLDATPAIRLAVPFFKPQYLPQWSDEIDQEFQNDNPLRRILVENRIPNSDLDPLD